MGHSTVKWVLVLFSLVTGIHQAPVSGAAGHAVQLENEFYAVEVKHPHGLISRVYDKVGRIDLITEPRLADNFRLLIPLPDLEGNYVLGKDQKLTSLDQETTGSLTLTWKGPLVNTKGSYDLDVAMRLALVGEALHVTLRIENRMSREIAEVWYPILGGIMGLGKREDTREMINIGWSGSAGTRMFHHFPSVGGGALGIPEAETYWTYPGSPGDALDRYL